LKFKEGRRQDKTVPEYDRGAVYVRILLLYSTLSLFSSVYANAQANFLVIQEEVDQVLIKDLLLSRTGYYYVSGIRWNLQVASPYLGKADGSGKVIWIKDFGITGLRFAEKYVLAEVPDGLCMMYNLSNFVSKPSVPQLIKLDDNGNKLWTSSLESMPGFIGYSMDACQDDGFILAGDWGQDIGLARTDADGNLLWEKKFFLPNERDEVATILSCKDGGFIVAGSTTELSQYPYFQNILIFKVDQSGNLIWKRILGGVEQNLSNRMIQTRDGHYVVAAFNNKTLGQYTELIKITDAGEVVWDKIVVSSKPAFPLGLAELPNGNLIVTGQSLFPYPSPPQQTSIWIVSSTGEFISQRLYEVCSGCASLGEDVVIDTDGNPVILGNATPEATKDEFYLMKLGPEGCLMPGVDLGPDIETCGESVSFSIPDGYKSYRWNTNATTSSVTVSLPGVYAVTVISEDNCIRTDSVTVDVKNCAVRNTCTNVIYTEEELSLPNVITPNADQENQYFEVSDMFLGSELSIFNRWGNRIYQSEAYSNNWDGGDVSPGVYYYILNNSCFNRSIRGNLTVIK
jgi:gliding motility-associated-like protein